MKNKTFTRLLCLALALLCLVSSAGIVVSAQEIQHDNLTDKTIADYKETLDLISYAEYQNLYYANAEKLSAEISVELTKNWKYTWSNIVVTATNGVWEMIVLGDRFYETAEDIPAEIAQENRYQVDDGRWREITNRYATVDAAKEAGYDTENLPYFDEYGTGDEKKVALRTPGRGAITWTVDLGSNNVTAATLASIGLDYYPIEARSTPIEREFYINGKPVFSEAYILSFSKVWGMYAQGSSDGATAKTDLSAKYTLGKKDNLADIIAKAEAAGYVSEAGVSASGAPVYTVAADNSYIVFYQPAYITAKLSAFISEFGLRFFPVDFNSNEIRPTQLQAPEWRRYIISDSDGYTHSYDLTNAQGETVTYDSEYFGFVLTPNENGEVKITLEGVNEPMALSTLTLMTYKAADTYEVYRQKIEAVAGNKLGESVIKLEAENPWRTSSNVVYPVEDRASALTSPVDPSVQLLNTIGGEKWATPGQWVEYTFSVDSSGW